MEGVDIQFISPRKVLGVFGSLTVSSELGSYLVSGKRREVRRVVQVERLTWNIFTQFGDSKDLTRHHHQSQVKRSGIVVTPFCRVKRLQNVSNFILNLVVLNREYLKFYQWNNLFKIIKRIKFQLRLRTSPLHRTLPRHWTNFVVKRVETLFLLS